MGIKITKNNNLPISCFDLVTDVLKLKCVFSFFFLLKCFFKFRVELNLGNQWMMGETYLEKLYRSTIAFHV